MPEIIPFDKCIHCGSAAGGGAAADISTKVMVEIGSGEANVEAEEFFFYLYELHSGSGDSARVHRGILVAVHLEEFSSGKILPVEKQNLAGVEQTLNQLEISRCQTEAVTALYSDPCCVFEALGQKEKQRPPDLDFTTADHVRCKLWKVMGQTFFSKVQAMLDKKSVILVQGRNMYEAMLGFRDLMRQKYAECSGRECFNYIVMALSNIDDFSETSGLEICPVAAACCGEAVKDVPLLLGRLGGFFTVDATQVSTDVEQLEKHICAALHTPQGQNAILLYGGGDHVYSLTLRSTEQLQSIELDEKQPGADTPIVLLNRLVLEHILSLSAHHPHSEQVCSPAASIADACHTVGAAQGRVAFFTRGPTAAQIRDLAWDNIQFPQGLVRYHPLMPPEMVNFLLCS